LSEEEIAKTIKTKVSELNELITQANDLDMNVQVIQAMRENKNNLTLWSHFRVSIYKNVEPNYF
jgi:hypothetical protein